MDGQLVIHGKPTEGELLSLNLFDGFEDKIYSDFFGSSVKPTVSPCYVFELRRWKGVAYSVYSYYVDGRDKYGSGNGYCVISLIIKDYFSNEYEQMMSILKGLYTSILKGKLNIIDESGKYLVSSLHGSIEISLLGKMYENIVSQFQWINIPSSLNIAKPQEAPVCLNVKDATDTSIYQTVKKNGRVYISSGFLSNNERTYTQNNQEKKQFSENIYDNNYNDRSTLEDENSEVINKIDRAKSDIIKNIEYLLSTYLPADQAGNFRDSDIEKSSTLSSCGFSLVKLSHWIALVNCCLLLICAFYIINDHHSATNSQYLEVQGDSLNVVMKQIPELEYQTIVTERDSLDMIVKAFNKNNWPKINVDKVSNGQLKMKDSGNLSLYFGEKYNPKDGLRGQFIIKEGSAANIENDNVIPIEPGVITIVYIEDGAILASKIIEIID